MKARILFVTLFVLVISMLGAIAVQAQGPVGGRSPSGGTLVTSFTYQGQLKNNGSPVNSSCDFIFYLYDGLTSSTYVGNSPQVKTNVSIANGLFTLELDFGVSAFNGDDRYLSTQTRCPTNTGMYTQLPRQHLTPTPMAFALPGFYTRQNDTSPNILGGFDGNSIVSGLTGATISGGGYNLYENVIGTGGSYAAIGGGYANFAASTGSTIGGGAVNRADHIFSSVAGGSYNLAGNDFSAVLGGSHNTASGPYATVVGGCYNEASGRGAFIGGGGVDGSTACTSTSHSVASGPSSVIAGGKENTADGLYAAIGGGAANISNGHGSTVPGGLQNTAQGDYSFATGFHAKAMHDGSFVFADLDSHDFSTTGINQFKVRATGGVRFVVQTDPYGVPTVSYLLNDSSASWQCSSDRNVKENFVAVDGKDILQRLVQMPITQWNVIGTDPKVKHIGPTAQDFRAAFGLGDDDKAIDTIDAQGIALVSIQGLYQVVKDQDSQITQLSSQVADLKQQNQSLESRVAALEQLAGTGGSGSRADINWNLGIVILGALAGLVIVRRPGQGVGR